jgi:hypothetical protein
MPKNRETLKNMLENISAQLSHSRPDESRVAKHKFGDF